MSPLRILALTFALAFATQSSGALELLSEPPCCDDERCPKANDEGQCPPSCSTCASAKVFTARLLPPLHAPVELADAEKALAIVDCCAPDGVSDDVFHPPRA